MWIPLNEPRHVNHWLERRNKHVWSLLFTHYCCMWICWRGRHSVCMWQRSALWSRLSPSTFNMGSGDWTWGPQASVAYLLSISRNPVLFLVVVVLRKSLTMDPWAARNSLCRPGLGSNSHSSTASARALGSMACTVAVLFWDRGSSVVQAGLQLLTELFN